MRKGNDRLLERSSSLQVELDVLCVRVVGTGDLLVELLVPFVDVIDVGVVMVLPPSAEVLTPLKSKATSKRTREEMHTD